MRQLVICSNSFIKTYKNKIISSGQIKLKGKEVHFAMIDFKEPQFDAVKRPHHVLVRKNAFSCNYRDIALILKSNEFIENGNRLNIYPIGSEFSGTIVEIGNQVRDLKVGDKVICDAFYPYNTESDAMPGLPTNGASRELEILHAEKLAVIPDSMTAGVGAAFTIGAQTVYSMIEKLAIKKHDRILINGIKSNTSLFAINALKNSNVVLCGTSRSSVDEEFYKKLGLDHIFYVGNEGFGASEPLQSYIHAQGKFNAVIDPFSDSYLFESVDVMDVNGKYVTCGVSNQTSLDKTEINLSLEMAKIMMSNISIMGNCLGSTLNLHQAIQDYADEKLEVLIDEQVGNHDVQHFMNKSFLSKERLGKVVFKYADFPIEINENNSRHRHSLIRADVSAV